jgi:hypothetical protein
MADALALYESPFTDVAPTGSDAIFAVDQVEKLIGALEAVTASAMAA